MYCKSTLHTQVVKFFAENRGNNNKEKLTWLQ